MGRVHHYLKVLFTNFTAVNKPCCSPFQGAYYLRAKFVYGGYFGKGLIEIAEGGKAG